jgi:hypothetical protein
MGDALRSNAERLLRDVQQIHSRMTSELARPALERGGRSSSPARPRPRDNAFAMPVDEDSLDVPEFLPPR